MHPAASIEVRTNRRVRARVHIQEHPAMPELTIVQFTDADSDTVVELALSPENAGLLVEQLTNRLAMLGLIEKASEGLAS